MITASIVTYRTNPTELSGLLDSISKSEIGKIWIIDNGMDQSIRSVVATYTSATYIPSENVGYGCAHNIAIRQAIDNCSDIHIILNTDLSFHPDTISLLAEYMRTHPDVVACQPRILNTDGSDQYSARLLPTPFDLFIRRFLPTWAFRHRRNKYLLKHLDRTRPFEAPYLQGSFIVLRISALSSVGLFDERYFMYPEDIDLCRRLLSAGKVISLPTPHVIHHHEQASYKSLRMTWVHASNMIRYFNKWGWFFDPLRRKINRDINRQKL